MRVGLCRKKFSHIWEIVAWHIPFFVKIVYIFNMDSKSIAKEDGLDSHFGKNIVLSYLNIGGIRMRKNEKDKRENAENLQMEGVMRCRKTGRELMNQINDEKFLCQIITILRKHIEKRGG